MVRGRVRAATAGGDRDVQRRDRRAAWALARARTSVLARLVAAQLIGWNVGNASALGGSSVSPR
jgi:hypothetical protein